MTEMLRGTCFAMCPEKERWLYGNLSYPQVNIIFESDVSVFS